CRHDRTGAGRAVRGGGPRGDAQQLAGCHARMSLAPYGTSAPLTRHGARPGQTAELSFMRVERLTGTSSRGTVQAAPDGRIRIGKPGRRSAGLWKSLRPLHETWTKAAEGERRNRAPGGDASGRATRAGTGGTAGAEAVEHRRASRTVEF